MLVGRVLGVDALAAVGSTGSVNFLILGFCLGICSGCAIPIAQRFGAKDYRELRRLVANCVWVCSGIAIVLMTLVSILCRQILIMMRTPENILDQAHSYILIIFLGIPATMLYNMVSAIIRALGDSKTPLYFLIISSFMNIALDLIFLVPLGMGVQGAALATVISQGTAGLLCLLYMRKNYEVLRLEKEDWKLDTRLMRILCGMGVPMGLQYSITAIGSVILQTSVNSLGSDAVAAITAANKVSMFFCCILDALGVTMANYGGQNVGARRLDRVREGLKAAGVIGITYAIASFVVLFFAARPLCGLFLGNARGDLLDQARDFLLITAAFYIALAFVDEVRYLIQGLGYSRLAMSAGLCEMVGRVLAGVILVPIWGFAGAGLASPLAWIIADAFLFPAYFSVMKKLEKQFAEG